MKPMRLFSPFGCHLAPSVHILNLLANLEWGGIFFLRKGGKQSSDKGRTLNQVIFTASTAVIFGLAVVKQCT